MAAVLDDRELQRIYSWVDEIPLSRPKRSITRDFSDGVLLAEVVHYHFPKLVESAFTAGPAPPLPPACLLNPRPAPPARPPLPFTTQSTTIRARTRCGRRCTTGAR